MIATCFIEFKHSLVLIKVIIKENMCKKGAKKGSATTGLSIARRLCLAMIITSLSLKKGSKEREVSCSFLTGSMG